MDLVDLMQQRSHEHRQNWRNGDPRTSVIAGEAAEREFAGTQREKVLQVLRKFNRPMSPEEIAKLLGFATHHPVNRRLPELLDLGLVERCPETRDNNSGKPAHLWKASA